MAVTDFVLITGNIRTKKIPFEINIYKTHPTANTLCNVFAYLLWG